MIKVQLNALNKTINYNNNTIYLDNEQFNYLINNKFSTNNYNLYPCLKRNNKLINLLHYFYKFNDNDCDYHFINGNKFDIRNSNVKVYHKYHKLICNKYSNCEYFIGHCNNMGKDSYTMKNPYWKIIENDEEYYLMHCYPDTLIKLDEDSLKKIREFENNNNNGKTITFYKHENGYICCALNLYIHQIIMNSYGHGKGTNNYSIDHINRNPLDNRTLNLTIATSKEQNLNSKGVIPGTKRNRICNAQELPTGIVQEDIPKYVYYCKEKYNKNGYMRDFFRIEKHPNQKKIISTSKSMKITLETKLEEAKEIIKKLDADIYYSEESNVSNENNNLKLPTHFYITNIRNLPHLVYDNRQYKMEEIDGKIKKVVNVKSLKIKLPDNYKLLEQYTKFLEKLHYKYPELIE